MFSLFGKAFIPKKLIPEVSKQFKRAGYSEVPYSLFGILFYATLIITYFIYFPTIYTLISNSNKIIFFIVTFATWAIAPLILSAISILGIYFYIDLKIFNRTKKMEDKLPDYLNMVATNLKGGMSFERSLWGAIKDEYGLLSTEIAIVAKKVMTGSNTAQALEQFSKKYPSPIIRRSINLIVSEIESGGKISEIIDRVVEDLKKTRMLKQEMAASTLTYVIFITVIVIVISPVLFSLSFQLLNVMLGFMKNFSNVDASSMLSFNAETGIKPEQFKQFSFFAISIISIFASAIISIIQKGDVRSGIKYMPMFWLSSIGVYILAYEILRSAFSGLIT